MVYLDGFAGYGRYKGDLGHPYKNGPVWGSPVIGLRQLEAASTRGHNSGINVRVTGILVDLDRDGQIQELEENLHEAGIVTPIARLANANEIRKGRVNLISGDFRDHIDDIVDSIQSSDFLLAFLDPYGEAMRMDSLTRILSRSKTDSIVLFPTNTVDRFGSSVAKSPQDLDPQESLNIERINGLYGSDEWQQIPIDQKLQRSDREAAYGALYRNRVQAIDKDLWVKNIALRFTEVNREAYSLLLTTRDADGGMRMNGILRKAEARKYWSVWEDVEARRRSRNAEKGIYGLFPESPLTAPPDIKSEPIAEEDVISSILSVVRPEEALGYKTLLGKLCDTAYMSKEINSALRSLRNQGQFAFKQLRKGSTIRRLR